MNPRFKFYFDGELVNNPTNIKDFVSSIKRNNELNAIFVLNESSFEWGGEGYIYLREAYKENSFCQSVTVTVYEDCCQNENYELIETGIIKISKCEFSRWEKTVKVTVIDDSYFARVDNNKSIVGQIDIGKSKSGFPIAPATRIQIYPFDPCDGTGGLIGKRKMFPVYEAFRFIIAYMTDGEMDFDSPVFGVGGEYEFTVMHTGEYLTGGSVSSTAFAPNISFEQIYKNFLRKLNLGFYIDVSGIKPKLIVDYDSNIFVNSVSKSFLDVIGIKESFDLERLYAKLKVGNTDIGEGDGSCEDTGTFNSKLNIIGFKEEEYNFFGQCNIDKMLDLTTDFIFDTNIIENVLKTNDTSFNDKIFVIDCYKTGVQVRARQGDILDAGALPYFYNKRFSNADSLLNYKDNLPNTLAYYLDNPIVDLFEVQHDSDYPSTEQTALPAGTTFSPFTFPNEIEDVGTVFTTNRFTADSNSLVMYKLKGNIKNIRSVSSTVTGEFRMIVRVKHYDSSNAYIQQHEYPLYGHSAPYFDPGNANNGYDYDFEINNQFEMLQNEILDVEIYVFSYRTGPSPCNLTYFFDDINWSARGNTAASGIVQTNDTKDYRAIKVNFKTIISKTVFEELIAKSKEMIEVDDGTDPIYGWIDSVLYNRFSNEATFNLLSKQKR